MSKLFDPHRFETDMLAPSRSFVARAIPVQGGFIAQFSAPGLIPHYVGRDQDNPRVFATAKEAEDAARLTAIEVANKPRKTQRRGKDVRYEKLTGPDFAVLLAESGLSLTLFSYIYGTSVDRAQSWVDGLDNAPHPARVLLEIFKANPDMVDVAEDVTNAATTERKPR